jgi:hypothetical protein
LTMPTELLLSPAPSRVMPIDMVKCLPVDR